VSQKGVVAATAGGIRVADSQNNRIQRFDASGDIYVADSPNDRIRKFACP